jgi:hypothetical protein
MKTISKKLLKITKEEQNIMNKYMKNSFWNSENNYKKFNRLRI